MTEFRLVGGKGGVGKTTCAAAMAVQAARRGHRTLVITTDPAPSLADALQVPLGAAPRRVAPGLPTLHAVELDAPRAFRTWLSGRRAVLEDIATRGTWLDHDDVARLLRLSMPGIDEVAALFEILALVRSGKYDLIVVDTAPTGHTLRLLAMPDALHRVASVFDAMQAKYRAVVSALRGTWQPDAGDRLIGELAQSAADLRELLRDPARVKVYWVTLPEPMAVSETLDAVESLRGVDIPIEALVVNRLTGVPLSACARCTARRAFESRALRRLGRALPGLPQRAIETRRREPRGVRPLGAIGRALDEAAAPAPAAVGGSPRWRAWAMRRSRPVVLSLIPASARLLMFGGKGGVGKTTCAAAAALVIAASAPGRRVLLVSTDPAHSVGDALACPVGDDTRSVPLAPRNMRARELDAPRRFSILRERYVAAIEALFTRSSSTMLDASHDRRVLAELIELAPPGLDELIAVAEAADLLDESGTFDVIVMDLAPSGHALRLLETPQLVQDWVRTLMGILLKYQAVVGIGELGAMLLELSKSLGRLRELLTDPARCRFVAVTRAAELPRAETGRLLARLARLRVPVTALVVNAVGRGSCGRCQAEASAERRQLGLLRQEADGSGIPIVTTPDHEPAPAGPRALREWCAAWRVEPVPGTQSTARRRSSPHGRRRVRVSSLGHR